MKPTYAALAALLALGGCASSPPPTTAARVPANPPGFSREPAPRHLESAQAEQRTALERQVMELQQELAQLRQLFRLQQVPLEREASAASVQKPSEKGPMPTPITTAPAAPAPANYTALFRFASAELDPSAKAALAALRPQLASAERVTLSAFADKVGAPDINQKLATARAEAAIEQLVKLGVSRDRISATATVVDSKPAEHITLLGLFRPADAAGRRVDLSLIARPTTTGGLE